MESRFDDELAEAIQRAAEDAKESRGISMNSYGAGYDAGFLAGLQRAKELKDELTARSAA